MTTYSDSDVKDLVRERYGKLAQSATSCCDTDDCCDDQRTLYAQSTLRR